MTEKSTEEIVRELADREAIRDLARRYAHYVWTGNVEAIGQLFTEDCEMDAGPDRPVMRGRQALIDSYKEILIPGAFQPFVHNHVIDLQGDRATGVCYLDLRSVQDGRSMIGAGHYEDEYVRVGGEWKFRSRRLRMAFLVPLDEGWASQG